MFKAILNDAHTNETLKTEDLKATSLKAAKMEYTKNSIPDSLKKGTWISYNGMAWKGNYQVEVWIGQFS